MVERNISLKKYNTFGIDVKAAFFAEFRNQEDLLELLDDEELNKLPKLILGGGSNILFTKDFDGLVLKNVIPGVELLRTEGETVMVKAGSGVVWHQFVNWCINNDFSGVENLSLIPGCTGASPIQNIGAYGVELKDSFYNLNAVEIATGKLVSFDKEKCAFGYRDSIFKNEYKGRLVITSVTFELQKNHKFKLSYGAIEQELKRMGVSTPTLRAVSDAVCNIRRSKLPDPLKIGNAGSFFKNPEVDESFYNTLKSTFPEVVAYPAGIARFKLAAGWLIEQCGWKGKIVGNTGSHKDQALVLVNYGKASGFEILDLAMKIKDSVKEKFGVDIEPEVNVI